MSETIHGHTIDGDPTALHYLENLHPQEVETIIDQARIHGKSYFKYDDNHYEVARTENGTYTVAKTQSGGWF